MTCHCKYVKEHQREDSHLVGCVFHSESLKNNLNLGIINT
jgi:hypothetical protein